MANNDKEILQDIARASEFPITISQEELFNLIGINNDLSSQDNVSKLFNIASNPTVASLPDEIRLAAIRTAQEMIGKLFLDALQTFDAEE